MWLERARKLGKPESASSAEAAIAMCEERYEDALRHLAKATAHIDRQRLHSGLAHFAKAKYAQFEDQCRAALDSANRRVRG